VLGIEDFSRIASKFQIFFSIGEARILTVGSGTAGDHQGRQKNGEGDNEGGNDGAEELRDKIGRTADESTLIWRLRGRVKEALKSFLK
jgi:hypothetical protein